MPSNIMGKEIACNWLHLLDIWSSKSGRFYYISISGTFHFQGLPTIPFSQAFLGWVCVRQGVTFLEKSLSGFYRSFSKNSPQLISGPSNRRRRRETSLSSRRGSHRRKRWRRRWWRHRRPAVGRPGFRDRRRCWPRCRRTSGSRGSSAETGTGKKWGTQRGGQISHPAIKWAFQAFQQNESSAIKSFFKSKQLPSTFNFR